MEFKTVAERAVLPEHSNKPTERVWGFGLLVAISLFSAVIISATFTCIAALGLKYTGYKAPFGEVMLSLALSFVLALTYLWFLDRRAIPRIILFVEQLAQVDVNRDGRIGPGPREPVRVEFLPTNPYLGQQAALKDLRKQKSQQIIDFIYGCFDKGTTAESYWVTGEPRMPRDEYIEYRELLIKLGYAQRSGTGQTAGWKFLPTITDPETVVLGLIGQDAL